MKVFGHRGARGHAPENTLLSFQTAIEQGVDMIELDVHVLKSGEVILMHDLLVNRTTNGKGYVEEFEFDHLRSLDAGRGEKIPTLAEVIEFVDRRVRIDVELKGPGSATYVAELLIEFIGKGWNTSDFFVSSFNHHELAEFKRLLPNVAAGALMDAVPLDYAAFAEQLQATAVCPGHEFVNRAYVDDAHKRGLDVYVWTVNEPEEVKRMFTMGVDGIFTDTPDIALATIAELLQADDPRRVPGLRTTFATK